MRRHSRLLTCTAALVSLVMQACVSAGHRPPGHLTARTPSDVALRSTVAISTPLAPRTGSESQAIAAGGFLFASGQLPLDPKTGEIVGGSTERAAGRVFDNLEAVLRAAGLTLADVVKTTVILTSERELAELDPVYRRRFAGHLPARTVFVADSVVCDCLLEIDVIARTRDAGASPEAR